MARNNTVAALTIILCLYADSTTTLKKLASSELFPPASSKLRQVHALVSLETATMIPSGRHIKNTHKTEPSLSGRLNTNGQVDETKRDQIKTWPTRISVKSVNDLVTQSSNTHTWITSTPAPVRNMNALLTTTDPAQGTTVNQAHSRPDDHSRLKLLSPSPSAISGDRQHNEGKLDELTDNLNRNCSCERTKCDCSGLSLTSVPQYLDTSITELSLYNNEIKILPENVFSRYSQMENLNMSNNYLEMFDNNTFKGLCKLTSLDLSRNWIGILYYTLPERIFEPLESLKFLRLNFNIASLSFSTARYLLVNPLMYLPHVEELRVDYYNNSDFGPEYNNMTSLRRLTVSCGYTLMKHLWNGIFQNLGHITSLDLTVCGLSGPTIETRAFSHLTNLLTLNITYNQNIGVEYLSSIMFGLRNSRLESLIMNNIVQDYSLTVITRSMVQYMPQSLTTLVARENNILFVEADAIKALPKSLKMIDISENYLIIDPSISPLEELAGLETLLLSSNGDECFINDQESIVQLPSNAFPLWQNKNYSERKTLTRTRTAEDSWKPKVVIPWNLKSVKVSVKNIYSEFLQSIDDNNTLEHLDLSCSYLPLVYMDSFKQLTRLSYLNLWKSSVQELVLTSGQDMSSLKTLLLGSNFLREFCNRWQAPFHSLSNISYLDLSLNQLDNLPKDLFKGLRVLEYIRLDGNLFSHFDVNISILVQLKLLNLSNTGLSYLPTEVRSHIDQLCKDRSRQIRVDMANCPIQCDCFNLDFLKWIVSSAAFDKNFTGYKCKYPDTSSKYILDRYQETIRVLDRECAKNYPMFLIVLAGTSVLLFAVVGAILYRLRWKIRYLYYAAYLKFTDKHKNDNNHEFTYDVFVSYDSEDRAFVTKNLSPELETRDLKLLIHGRDFVAGTYITSNIVMAVTESRKTLVVLTRNLLESTWCNYELQMATMEAVHTGRQVLVFLLKEDIPSRELDVELLGHIRSNTYLPYPVPEEEGDEDIMRRFYDKLAHDLRC